MSKSGIGKISCLENRSNEYISVKVRREREEKGFVVYDKIVVKAWKNFIILLLFFQEMKAAQSRI
jgi:hypothetical protein